METKVQAVNFTAQQELVDFVNTRLEKLAQFSDQITTSEVFLKVDKNDMGENKIAEIKLNLPGKELFAKKQSDSFEEAIDNVVEALKKQIEKHKAKVV
jgi:putative sigma-54 modulation protein